MPSIVRQFQRLTSGEEGPPRTEDVNSLLGTIAAALHGCIHCWFRDVGQFHTQLAAKLPRRRDVPKRQLSDWSRALMYLRLIPAHIDRWPTDEESVQILTQLAEHPERVIRLPAAAALISAGCVPGRAALSELCECVSGHSRFPSHIYGMKAPKQFRRLLVKHQAQLWQVGCTALAELAYDSILSDIANETACVGGLRPDIIVNDGSVRTEDGLIVWADTIIDAKSGVAPEIPPYRDLCARLEVWHTGSLGGWIERSSDDHCQIVYRAAADLSALAQQRGDEALARDIRTLADEGHHIALYLHYLKGRSEFVPTHADLEAYLAGQPNSP